MPAGQEIAGEMILHLGGIVMRTDDSYTQKFTKQVVPPTRRYFHPLYRGTWFPTCAKTSSTRKTSTVSIRYIAVLGFQRTVLPSLASGQHMVSIRYIAVLGFQQEWLEYYGIPSDGFHPLYRGTWFPTWVYCEHSGARDLVSIRYIAVLGFQHSFRSVRYRDKATVSIRYIAVLGFQRCGATWGVNPTMMSFHPLYRGTWFPTLPQKRPL